jgi:hypothetical protein
VQAEQSNSCKQCREQQQACAKNYAAKTCKTEYDICMKGCQKNSQIGQPDPARRDKAFTATTARGRHGPSLLMPGSNI